MGLCRLYAQIHIQKKSSVCNLKCIKFICEKKIDHLDLLEIHWSFKEIHWSLEFSSIGNQWLKIFCGLNAWIQNIQYKSQIELAIIIYCIYLCVCQLIYSSEHPFYLKLKRKWEKEFMCLIKKSQESVIRSEKNTFMNKVEKWCEDDAFSKWKNLYWDEEGIPKKQTNKQMNWHGSVRRDQLSGK